MSLGESYDAPEKREAQLAESAREKEYPATTHACTVQMEIVWVH